MRKIAILSFAILLICVLFLSGCQGISDLTGGQTGASSGELVALVIIIVSVLFVVLLVGLARAGTQKNITIHTYPTDSERSKVIVHHKEDELTNGKTSFARCEICDNSIDTRLLKVVVVEGKELFLCERCRNVVNKKSEQISQDEALKIIKLRYAKGEITKEQFEQMKKDLEE